MFRYVVRVFRALRSRGKSFRLRIRRFMLPLTVALLGVNLFYSQFVVGKKVDPESRRVAHRLEEIGRTTDPVVDGWLDTWNDTMFVRRLWENRPPAEWAERGVSVLLFRDTTLVYWSHDIFQARSNVFWLASESSLRQIGDLQLVSRLERRGDKSAVVAVELYDRRTGRYNPALFPDQRIALLSAGDSVRARLVQAEPIEVGPGRFFVEARAMTAMPWWAEYCGWAGVMMLCFWVKNLVRRRTSRENVYWCAAALLGVLAVLRVGLFLSGMPNENSVLFSRIYGLHNPILISLGDLILSYGLFFVWAVYLFQVRTKLGWKFRQLGRAGQAAVAGAFCTMIAGIVAVFHYALILSIYSPKINLQIYDIFQLSYISVVFYLLTVLFVGGRILIGYTNLSLFGNRGIGWRVGFTVALILLFLWPVSDQIHGTGGGLVVFYLLSMAAHYIRMINRRYPSFLISLVIFSLYVSYFATRENRSAQNNAQMLYARILGTVPQDRILRNDVAGGDERNLDDRFRDFTYARVRDNRIAFQYGNGYDYQALTDAVATGRDTLIRWNGKQHFLYNYYVDGQRNTLIVSRKMSTMLDAVALFTYIFLLLFILCGLVLELVGYTFDIHRLGSRMTFRIRVVVIGVVLFAMLAVTLVIVNHTLVNFREEQRRFVNNHMQRLGVSIVDYLASRPLDPETARRWIDLENKDLRYDINLFWPNGDLAGASADHDRRIVRMNSEAYRALHYLNEPFFTFVDGSRYISAFAPIVVEGTLRGYLNLEYYSSNSNSSFLRHKLLVDVLSLFLIILCLAVVLSEILYRLLTKPFNRLHEALGNISRMEKIHDIGSGRKISDEVGMLVEQYNTMIDYLAESYRQLALNEREGAWREMARQVAHEIKNPLTPMRLKIQMLQRYLSHGSGEELKNRVEATLTLLLEQIDLLTKIASEFSDFAKLGEGHPERIDLVRLVCHVARLYAGDERIGIRLRIDGREVAADGAEVAEALPAVWVVADPDHLTRVFVNICQNAVQAMAAQRSGTIDIELRRIENRVQVRFVDSGPGIPEEIRDKIFVPNFTTKSSGSGLGLALSRKIVELLGGTITFDTILGVGTTFTVELPLDTLPAGDASAAGSSGTATGLPASEK